MMSNVHPYEMMKIRLLNASHLLIGYLGSLAGCTYVYEVMADPLFQLKAEMSSIAPDSAPLSPSDQAIH